MNFGGPPRSYPGHRKTDDEEQAMLHKELKEEAPRGRGKHYAPGENMSFKDVAKWTLGILGVAALCASAAFLLVILNMVAEYKDAWVTDASKFNNVVTFLSDTAEYTRYASARATQTRAYEIDYVKVINETLPDSEHRFAKHMLKGADAFDSAMGIIIKVNELGLLENADRYLNITLEASRTPEGAAFWKGIAGVFELVKKGPDSDAFKLFRAEIEGLLQVPLVASIVDLGFMTITQVVNDPEMRTGLVQVLAEAPRAMRAFAAVAEDPKNAEIIALVRDDIHAAIRQGMFRNILQTVASGSENTAEMLRQAYTGNFVNETVNAAHNLNTLSSRLDLATARIFGL